VPTGIASAPSSDTSTRRSGDGLATSNTAIERCFKHSMGGFGCVYGASFVNAKSGVDAPVVEIDNAGQTSTLRIRGCSPWQQPMKRSVSPVAGKTPNWRAVCGRTARTVRRGEGPGNQPVLPTPIGKIFLEKCILPCAPSRFRSRPKVHVANAVDAPDPRVLLPFKGCRVAPLTTIIKKNDPDRLTLLHRSS